MKIRNISIKKENLELIRPYTIAFKTVDAVENGIVTITCDNGLTGMGAFNPSYEVTGEELEDALSILNRKSIDWLIGRDFDEFDSLISWVQKNFSESPSARIGLEIALYDLVAQSKKMPLVQFLGQKIQSMPTSITIGIKNVEATLAEAEEYIGRKFRILKVKLGISLDEDIERLIRLREKYGNKIDLIIDANQGYDKASLAIFCEKTAHLNIKLIEQPLPTGQENEMRALPDHIKKLVAADESLLSPKDATALAKEPAACGYFNIKLMKCGGISEGLKIARTAEDHNINLMWGCNDESIISITAALHTAFSCAHTKFIDLDGSLDLAKDVVKGGFILKEGVMSISDKPGLGLASLQ
ncbi:MAG TPA: dipeptide epimerase [Flavitalea sp.]|nr:dipeptide epimerase [Flavitalea sp.]